MDGRSLSTHAPVARLDGQVLFEARIDRGIQQRATALLNAIVQEERDRCIGCGAYRRSSRRRGYRNGFEPRSLDTPFGRLRRRWHSVEPDAVARFADEFDLTLRFLPAPPRWRERLKTNNPLERFSRERNRRRGPRGIFPSDPSLDRAVFLAWEDLKHGGYAPTRTAHANPPFTRTS